MEEYIKAKYSVASDSQRNVRKYSEPKETLLEIVLDVVEFALRFSFMVMFLYSLMMSVRGE